MRKIVLLAISLFAVILIYAQPPNVPANSGATFGNKITADGAIAIDELMNEINQKQTSAKEMHVKIKAVANEVCKEMGCWLTLKSPDGDIMVKMKDDSFFVPLAISGKEIIVDGLAKEKITSVEQLKHRAKDAGKTEEEIAKIAGPKKEIIIEAKGVLVL
jgi:hypothetical protein